MDFINENILSIYTERIIVKKIIKKTKKYDEMLFIPTELPTVLIPSIKSICKLIGKLFTSS